MQANKTSTVNYGSFTGVAHQHDEPQDWRIRLDEAVHRVDEGEIWQIMATHQSEQAQSVLADIVSRMAYEHLGKTVYCEIFMMPIIQMAQGTGPIGDAQVWASIHKPVTEAIKRWFPPENQVVLFDNVVPLDWVTTWTPKILRYHLHRLIPNSSRKVVEFVSEDIDLPAHSPRLGFVNMVCTNRYRYPEVPAVDTQRDDRLKSVVKYSIEMATSTIGTTALPEVLVPERVQISVADGVCLWLQALNDKVGIEGFALHQSLHTIDVVKVTLKLRDEDVPKTQFALRIHQIGSQGLQDIITVLQSLAPNLEVPADYTAAQAAKIASTSH